MVPARSVHDAMSGDPWVMGVRDGRAYRQPVTLGLRGQTIIEIKGGLEEGAWAIPVGAGVLTGQRVRPFTP